MNWRQSDKNILVAGHRGNPYEAPENTMASFRNAVDLGVDMLELDIQMTLDEELVIIHNFSVDDTTNGTGLVKNMTIKEIRALDAGAKFSSCYKGEKIPTFIEFLEYFSSFPSLLFNFELKEYPERENVERSYKTADMVISLIEKYNLAHRCVLNAFSSKLLHYIHKKYQGKYKLHGFYPPYLLNPQNGMDPYTNLYCVCICDEFTKKTFDIFKEKNIDTWVGPRFKDKSSIDFIHQCGATLITCDNPREVITILRDMNLHK